MALAVLAILSAAPVKASPDPTTVRFLYQTCKEEAAANAQRFCLGYIMGVGQLMAVNAGFGNNFALCSIPRGSVPTARAMIQVFTSWAEKHPESWSQRYVYGVALALKESWPCSTENTTLSDASP
jgi:hypothetical protein